MSINFTYDTIKNNNQKTLFSFNLCVNFASVREKP